VPDDFDVVWNCTVAIRTHLNYDALNDAAHRFLQIASDFKFYRLSNLFRLQPKVNAEVRKLYLGKKVQAYKIYNYISEIMHCIHSYEWLTEHKMSPDTMKRGDREQCAMDQAELAELLGRFSFFFIVTNSAFLIPLLFANISQRSWHSPGVYIRNFVTWMTTISPSCARKKQEPELAFFFTIASRKA